MKKIFIIALLLPKFSYALNPVSVQCESLSGYTTEFMNNNFEQSEDKISSPITFIFDYRNNKILDSTGTTYILLQSEKSFVGFSRYDTTEIMLSFYPDKNLVFISRHSNLLGIRYSGWTMAAQCSFQY